MDEKKMEIMERATAVFLRFGIKSVTMDDMARELGMSKKTLYAHFKDKNDLVNQIIAAKTSFDQELCSKVCFETENAIEELFQISIYVTEMLKGIHPSVFFDLRKFHPEAWQLMHDHKWRFVRETILNNISRGKKEGLYREELINEVIAGVYVGATDLISDTDTFASAEVKSDEALLEIIRFMIYGMANDKGRAYLRNRISKSD